MLYNLRTVEEIWKPLSVATVFNMMVRKNKAVLPCVYVATYIRFIKIFLYINAYGS